jgi:hypothetical protein
VEVERIVAVDRAEVEEIAGVVERHEDHDEAAQGVDGVETRGGGRG